MKPDDPPDNAATPEDVRHAIEALSKEDLYRLQKAANIYLSGTEYQNPMEIINEAITRTMSAANGYKGRRWPKHVPFMAYLIQTIKGLASDSRESPIQTKTEYYMEAMSTEDVKAEDVLDRIGGSHPDVVTQAIELGEIQERQDRARWDSDRIDAHFTGDSEVTWIIMGLKDGLSAADIRGLGEMTQNQYETARRRFRRGLEKLFPGERES